MPLPSFREFCRGAGIFVLSGSEKPRYDSCDNSFGNRSNTKAPNKGHGGHPKPEHQCKECAKRFRRKADMKRHERGRLPTVSPSKQALTYNEVRVECGCQGIWSVRELLMYANSFESDFGLDFAGADGYYGH